MRGLHFGFRKKQRFILPSQPDISASVVALGEENERSSCQMRSFDAQLEIKMKTAKNMTPEEKSKYDVYIKADWSKPIEGFADKRVSSLGQWIRQQRPSYSPGLQAKLFSLGAEEAQDGNWLDSYDALIIAEGLKGGTSTKESRQIATKVADKAAKETGAKALMLWEIVTRLDPKAARPMLKLAASGVGHDRAANLVQKALKIDPVVTTRSYREEPEFRDLRCNPKAARVRKTLPERLTEGVDCAAVSN